MNDFFYIFNISIAIICILRWFYDIILMKNRFKNCSVKIYVEYNDFTQANFLYKVIKHIKNKYLIDADIVFYNTEEV